MEDKKVRLQKYLAGAGVASRRKSEELIAQGRVSVNGAAVTEMGFKVDPERDIIEVDSKKIHTETRKVYILLNKPAGYVSTVSDQFDRPTVLSLIKGIPERVFPVGRLDYDSSGLLFLTNDGDFTYRITHPAHEMEKTYTAEVNGHFTEEELLRFEKGLQIEDYVTAPAKIKVIQKNRSSSVVEITIHEGKNRQVRKMCDAIGHGVIRLKRVKIGAVELGELKPGEWRYLDESEIEDLK